MMTDQDNSGSKYSDFNKHGYSERSLDMLESEEGQLNAIFACYGSAAQHGQLFEESLANLVVLLNDWLGGGSLMAGLEKKTIGQLLRHLETKFVEEIDDWVPKFLDEARERRNFLIHEYFLARSDEMGIEHGRLAMLRELVGIEAQLRRGAELVNGLCGNRGGEDGRAKGKRRWRNHFFGQAANRRQEMVSWFGKNIQNVILQHNGEKVVLVLQVDLRWLTQPYWYADRSKRMPSEAFGTLNYNMDDVHRLVQAYEALKPTGQGKRGLGHLTRSSIVTLCACWEQYIEDVIIEGVTYFKEQTNSPRDLPLTVRKVISKKVRDAKNELKPLELAGHGWKEIYLAFARDEVSNLHSPKTEKYKPYCPITWDLVIVLSKHGRVKRRK